MSTWVGTDSQQLYNLDRFAEIDMDMRTDGIHVIRAWRETAAVGADGRRYPRGEAVTLAELGTAEDAQSALEYLRSRLCRADFQAWGAEE